jgi:hypothetical protein
VSLARSAARRLVLQCLQRDPAARPSASYLLKAVDKIGSAAAAEGGASGSAGGSTGEASKRQSDASACASA